MLFRPWSRAAFLQLHSAGSLIESCFSSSRLYLEPIAQKATSSPAGNDIHSPGWIEINERVPVRYVLLRALFCSPRLVKSLITSNEPLRHSRPVITRGYHFLLVTETPVTLVYGMVACKLIFSCTTSRLHRRTKLVRYRPVK